MGASDILVRQHVNIDASALLEPQLKQQWIT